MRDALVALALSLAFLPGPSTRVVGDTASERCPLGRHGAAAAERQEQLQQWGYKLLEAGRVEDAVAFFQLHVVDARNRSGDREHSGS